MGKAYRIKSFAADYRSRLQLDRLVAQGAFEYRIDRLVKVGYSVETNIANEELRFSHNKKDLAREVGASLKKYLASQRT